MSVEHRVTVVVLTHDRADELMRTLWHLARLPERPPLVVVDNASRDGTSERVRRSFPQATLVRCERNLGAAGRNAGVDAVRTPYVAFCDDDTWWAPGSLRRAADLLDQHPRLGAVAARVLVGPEQREDPTCALMARSPLHVPGLPGPALIGFMAGAVVMRAQAFREVGGYDRRLFIGAEERLMGLDLAAAGWQMAYVAEVVTHHHPSPQRDAPGRRWLLARNELWIAWLRLPLASAWHETLRAWRQAGPNVRLHLCRAVLQGAAWVWRHRRVLPPEVEAMRQQVLGGPPPRRRGSRRRTQAGGA